MVEKYIAPQYDEAIFNCYRCNAPTHHSWNDPIVFLGSTTSYRFARCVVCESFSLWHTQDKSLLWPLKRVAPVASEFLEGDILSDYEEAAEISAISPRGSAALLRLALQKLLIKAGCKGDNLNDDIKDLVANKRIDVSMQEACDALRVIGNNAVHPGQLDLKDDKEMVGALFELLNYTAERLIGDSAKAKAVFNKLPQNAKDAIAKRDGIKST